MHDFLTTVIIPYAQDRGYFEAAKASVMRQSVKCELVCVNKPQSLSANVNLGIEFAKGKYIKILPDDDLLESDCIESLQNAIGDNDFIHANAINFWPQGKTRYHKSRHITTIDQLFQKNVIHGGTVLYRKDAIKEVGGFDESLWTGEEYDLHLRLLRNGYKLGFLDKVVFRYRRHGGQKSMGNKASLSARRDEIRRIKNKYR